MNFCKNLKMFRVPTANVKVDDCFDTFQYFAAHNLVGSARYR